jgi:glutaredoxin
MVKYYGRARQRTSGNTNSPGLNMSGIVSSVGHSHSAQRYIGRRVDGLAGVCGMPQQNGGSWKQSLKNKHPYCKPGVSKCLAAAGGVGHIKTSYYRTPASGEFGCNVTRRLSCEDEVNEFVDILNKDDGSTYSLISKSWCPFCKGAKWAINAIGKTYNTIEYDLLNKPCQQLLVNIMDLSQPFTFPQVYKNKDSKPIGASDLIDEILNETVPSPNHLLEYPIDYSAYVKPKAKDSYEIFNNNLKIIYDQLKII